MKLSMISPDKSPFLPGHYSNLNASVVMLILLLLLLYVHMWTREHLQGKDHVLFICVSNTRDYHIGDIEIALIPNIYRVFTKRWALYK